MTRRFVFQFMLNAVIPLLIATAIAAAEPFYQGKTLRVIVASAAGGGSDIVARLMMRHLSRHIPGNPTIIVENMPGAGEIIGTNYVYGKAKPDGLTALFATGTPINQLIELPGIEFDVTKMPIIGGSSESVAAFIRTDKTGVKSARDLLNPKAPIVIGGSGYGSIKDVSMLAAMNLLGVKNPTYVTGYGGAGPIRLAYERAEVNFTQETAVGISRSVLPWVREGWTSVLYQVGFLDGKGNVAKDPVWKELGIDAPSIAEVYRSIYGKDAAGARLGSGEGFDRRLLADANDGGRAQDSASARSPSCAKRFRRWARTKPSWRNGPRAKARRRAWCPAKKPATSPPRFSKRRRKR